MPWFGTSYSLALATYGTSLWARDADHAATPIKQRGLGEVVNGEGFPIKRPSEQFAAGDMLNGLHGLAFLSYLAVQSGVATPADILSDTGILHDMLHWVSFNEVERKDCKLSLPKLLRRVRRLEDKVPGYTAKES